MIHTLTFTDIDGPVDAEVTLSVLGRLRGRVINEDMVGEVVRITVEIVR